MARARASNFELLRILSMAGIVMQHYAGNKTWEWSRECETYSWFNEYVITCMGTTGKIGVDVFLLMTGFFLSARGLKSSSLARTWFQTVNWSYIFLVPAYYYGVIQQWQYKKVLFPITMHGYWFVASYVVAGFCTGWVASFAKNATPSQYLIGLLAMCFALMLCDWPLEICYSNVSYFVFVISLGAFLRRFQAKFARIRTRVLVATLVIASIVNYGSVYYFLFHDVKWAKARKGPTALTLENWSVLCLVYGLALTLLAQRWDFHSAAINKIASCSLGVYLTHENMFVQPRIWKYVVKGYRHKDSVWLPLVAVAQVFVVYMLCSGAEYVRQLIFGKVEEFVSSFIGSKMDTLSDHTNRIFNEDTEEKDMV